MKYNYNVKQKYSAPVADVVKLHTENVILASQLDDYDDNLIFGAPGLEDLPGIVL